MPNRPDFEELAGHLPAADWLGLALVLCFGLLGAWRGIWWQVFRFVGLALALGLAKALTAPLLGVLLGVAPNLHRGLGEALCFLGLSVLFLWALGLLGRLGLRALSVMHLRPLDRMAGALLGLLTGLILHGAAVLGADRWAPEVWAHENLDGTRSKAWAERFGQGVGHLWSQFPGLLSGLGDWSEQPPEPGDQQPASEPPPFDPPAGRPLDPTPLEAGDPGSPRVR